MEVLRLTTKIDESGHLKIDVPTYLAAGEVNLVVVVHPVSLESQKKRSYDFSDLVGCLSWQGNAVEMQRNLRDEW